jgi:hypothetical protein
VKWLHRNLTNIKKFDHDGNWLVVSIDPTNGFSVNDAASRPLSPQADDVREELNCWGDDVPVRSLLLTSEAVKKHTMRGGPPPESLRPLADLYFSARYIYFGGKLGAHPQVEMRWVAPDENGADQVIKGLKTLRTALKQPGNDLNVPPAFGTVLDLVQPTRDGNIVRVSMNQKDLSNLFAAIISASMNGGSSPSPQVPQQSISSDWKPLDAATDSAAAQMRMILAAIREYDQDHQALPASLDDLISAKLLPGAEILRDPRSSSGKAFVYVKPSAARLDAVASRDKIAILLEDQEVLASGQGLAGYADGHVGDAPKN